MPLVKVSDMVASSWLGGGHDRKVGGENRLMAIKNC
jgi:hypothetical protein